MANPSNSRTAKAESRRMLELREIMNGEIGRTTHGVWLIFGSVSGSPARQGPELHVQRRHRSNTSFDGNRSRRWALDARSLRAVHRVVSSCVSIGQSDVGTGSGQSSSSRSQSPAMLLTGCLAAVDRTVRAVKEGLAPPSHPNRLDHGFPCLSMRVALRSTSGM